MQVAEIYAKLSTARRLQVGSIIVKDDRIISIGYNGMPAGWDNNCEDKEFWKPDLEDLHHDELEAMYPNIATSDVDGSYIGRYRLVTKPQVLHAEANAIAKVARGPESAEDAVLFVTHSPCMNCAKLIYQSGIKQVFYRDNYRNSNGVDFLKQAGVTVNKLD